MNRRILALAVPSTIANITTPLLGLADTAITGHMGSAVYIGAIAVGGVMFNMVYWIFGFLRAGTSGMAAQAFGAADQKMQSLVLLRSVVVAAALGFLLVALHLPLLKLLGWLVDADADTSVLAAEYFRILIFGAPAVLSTFALSGWFLGMQNSRMLMVTSIIINLANIVVSVFLVFFLNWKIAGVATGTLVSQWLGLVVALCMLRRYRILKPSLSELFRLSDLKRFFKVNTDMMLRALCFIAMTTWFTKIGASQGPVILAVNTILMQFFLFFSFMMDGFAYSGEALIGRYIGASDIPSVRYCVSTLMKWGIGFSALFTLVYFLCGEGIIALLTADDMVRLSAKEYFYWAVTTPFAGVAAFVWDGVFIGATLTRELVLTMVIAVGAFFICYLVFWPIWGNHGLWLAFIVYLLTRWVVQTVIYRHHRF